MGGERLLICSPSFTGDFCAPYIESLVGTIKDCQRHEIPTAYKTLNGVHWIDIARDILCHIFLKSDCTHMLQIDSDLGWSPDAPRKMLKEDKPFIGGVYPLRADCPAFPIKRDGERVTGLPGGFMMIRRDVIEKLSTTTYKTSTLQFGELDVSPLFTREFKAGGYVGEDYAFCNRVLNAGYELTAMPGIEFTHTGNKTWRGVYAGND